MSNGQVCVRRCFLCGEDQHSGKNYDHRKAWLEERLRFLTGCFGIDLLAYAILSNHFHVVLRNRPDVVGGWSDEEVARRWLRLCPVRKSAQGLPEPPSDAEMAMIVHRPERLAEIRRRLSDISWFMRMIAEPIARQANREDRASGRFWEGRFKSVKLCDEAAILACCAYVDLNPLRAGLAETPEASRFTSAKTRIEARSEGPRPPAPANSTARPVTAPSERRRSRDEWLAPIPLQEATSAAGPAASHAAADGELPPRCSDKGFLPMSLDDYLRLLDWTGRQIVPGKCGAVPADAPPILARLGVAADDWLTLATCFGRLFARIAGRTSRLEKERRLGASRRFRFGPSRLFGEPAVAAG